MSKFSVRQVEPRDIPALEKLHAAQNRRDGTDYPLPLLFLRDEATGAWIRNPRLALAVVVERNGEPLQLLVAERTLEVMLFGCDPRATATIAQESEALKYLLSQQVDGIHILVPKQRVEQLQKPLERVGFERDDDSLAHFYMSLKELSQ